MKLFDLLAHYEPAVTAPTTTVHLASFNGAVHPLHMFKRGRFEDWQSLQTAKNFNRAHILGLVLLGEKGAWLLAGVYRNLDIHS